MLYNYLILDIYYELLAKIILIIITYYATYQEDASIQFVIFIYHIKKIIFV